MAAQTYEDTYQGFHIYIEPNPDQYRGGFIWGVSCGDEELAGDWVFSMESGVLEAEEFVLSEIQGS